MGEENLSSFILRLLELNSYISGSDPEETNTEKVQSKLQCFCSPQKKRRQRGRSSTILPKETLTAQKHMIRTTEFHS